MTPMTARLAARSQVVAAHAMRARGSRMAALGLVLGLLLGLTAFAPARWLASWLPVQSHLALTEARGTVWAGSARLWLTGGLDSADRVALPQRFHWRLSAHWRGLELQLRADCCTPEPLRVALQWRDGSAVLALADSRSSWPAQLLAGLGTPWNTLQLSGKLSLDTQGLQLRLSGGLQPSGRAALELHDLGSALSTLQPMGSYRLALNLAPEQGLQLQTLRGELQLSGQGRFTPTGLRFRGHAEAAPGREDALGNILNIIGKRDGARTLISLG